MGAAACSAARPARGARAPARAAAEPAVAQVSEELVDKCINAIRFLAIDGVEKANSGHPGLPMGCAPMSYVLWNEVMQHNPSNPKWVNRDRFVLSAGHGSMLIYSLLHLCGYPLETEDLAQFRQWGSKTPGHPENFMTSGVEVTTGPLGTGICNAVGLALAEKHLAARYNKADAPPVIDHYTYCIMGDGCNMEGVSNEACSLAGHWGLGKLIAFYDDNHISIDGHTDISFTEDVCARYEALGWHTIHVENGNTDYDAIRKAVEDAKAVTDKPTLIKVTTLIGYGSPNKADSHDVHGAALGPDEVAATRANLKWDYAPFEVPDDVYGAMRDSALQGCLGRGRLAGRPGGVRRQVPRGGRRVQAAHQRRAPRGLGVRPALLHPRGQGRGHPHPLPDEAQRAGPGPPRVHGRLRRPGALQHDPDEDVRRLPEGHAGGA